MARNTAYPVFDPYWVYVIEEIGGGPVKIGVARNPVYRLSDMQSGNSRPLALMYQHRTIGRQEAHRIEFAAHAEISNARVRGEWFRVSVAQAIEAIKGAANG